MGDYEIKKSTSAYHPGCKTAQVQVILRSESGYRIIKGFRYKRSDHESMVRAMRKALIELDRLQTIDRL